MIGLHNLGALAAGAILIGGLQLGGHTDLDQNATYHADGAGFVAVQGRHEVGPAMQSTAGLDQFASAQSGQYGMVPMAKAVFTKVEKQAVGVSRRVVATLVD